MGDYWKLIDGWIQAYRKMGVNKVKLEGVGIGF
jgi:hypothetical protein